MSFVKRNFYDILNASSSASFDELKSNYKQLILQCHPDKLQQQQQQQQKEIETSNHPQMNDDDPNNSEFVAITEAWNCLKDPIKRKQYDAEQLLRKFHTHNNIYAHIQLSEMKKQPITEEYLGDVQEEEEEEEEDDDETKEIANVQVSKEESHNKDGVSVSQYIYTYDCRCGGQYIVDESAEQQYCRPANNKQSFNSNDNNGVPHDDAHNKTNNDRNSSSGNANSGVQNDKNSHPHHHVKNTNNAGGAIGSSSRHHHNHSGAGVITPDNNADDDDGVVDVDEELIVECNECSLVIILNG